MQMDLNLEFICRIPIPRNAKHATEISQPFRDYYRNLAIARDELRTYFATEPNHHFLIGTADEGIDDVEDLEGGYLRSETY